MADTDYKGLKETLAELLLAKQRDKEKGDVERQARNDEDRTKILGNLSGDLAASLQPVLADFAKNSKLSMEDLRDVLAEAIQINMPEIKMPDIPAPIVNVPAPIVHVAAPNIPAPVVKVSPTPVTFPNEMSLKAGNRPFPVIMMDQAGKPMMFPQSMGASGGKADFFTIKDIQNSTGGSIIDSDGFLRVTGSFSVTSSATSTIAQLANADGTYYNSDNPLPTTATIALPAGQGDSATATRIIQAGDSVSSVIVNSGTITAVTGITNSIAVALVDSSGVQYSGSNPFDVVILGPINQGDEATAVRNVQAGNSIASTNTVQWGASAVATGLNENTAGVVKVYQVTSAINSINLVTLNGTAPATGLNETNAGVLRTVLMTDSVASVVVNSGTITTVTTVTGVTNTVNVRLDSPDGPYSAANPLPTTATLSLPAGQGDAATATRVVIAGNSDASVVVNSGTLTSVTTLGSITNTSAAQLTRQANPTAIASDYVPFAADDMGRSLTRPVQVRDLTITAYASIANGTETTLLAASAGSFHDLVYLILANSSDAAVLVDVRGVTAGNIFTTLAVPANGTVGISLGAMPAPASAADTGNNWTIDMPDITGTTVYATGLFSREV